MDKFPDVLRNFINETNWVVAITYDKIWPHEYIVRDKVDKKNFVEFVMHIRVHGYLGMFYSKDITYFDDSDMVDNGITYRRNHNHQ